MEEFNFLEEKKKKAEYITPQALRDFIKNKVGDCKDKIIFDCAVGSGQLLYGIEAKRKIGFDINEKAVEYAIKNGIEAKTQDYILYDDANLNYDYVITNYPFSLRATEEQNNYLSYKYGIKKYTGVLDKEFILKSFRKATKGFYLCFAGILYRNQELDFRKKIIDNNYVEEISILNNTGFKDTNINILYLQLSKQKTNNKIIINNIDNYKVIDTITITNEEVIKNNYNLSSTQYIKKEIKSISREEILKKNEEIYNSIFDTFEEELKIQIEFKSIFNEDFLFINNEDIIKRIDNIKKNIIDLLKKNNNI